MVSLSGLAFAAIAAVGWGVVLYASKRYFAEFHSATFMSLVFGCAALWYAPVGVAGALSTDTVATATPWTVGVVAGTVGVLTLGLFVLFWAISMGDVSYVAPVGKLTPVFVVPIEVVLLNEHLTPLQVTGVVVATVAVYVANYERGTVWLPLWRAVTYRPGQLALASAVILAVLDVSQRYVLQELAVESTVWIGLKLAGAALLLAPLGWRRTDRAAVRGALPQFLALGAVLALAEHFIGLAFAVLPASIASPVVATQALVAVLLGGVLLREGHFRLRLAAAVTAVAGITLVALF